MVYSGSIGLHHVLEELRKEGYINAPTNDMVEVEIAPLVRDDALDLATQLLTGENVATDDLSAVSQEIVDRVDGMPFFIQCIIADLSERGETIGVGDVDRLLEEKLRVYDTWKLDHYERRIKGYLLTTMYYPACSIKWGSIVGTSVALRERSFEKLLQNPCDRGKSLLSWIPL
jgi:hypothetical protein